MNKTIKLISIYIVLILMLLCGCNSGNSSAIIYYGVTEPMQTIDPQLASSTEELMIVRNIFEGLLRKNEKGEIVNGVISEYKKSGMVYSFNIKSDAVWSDGTRLTADDFVFAFRRALSPESKAPYAKSLYCIKNAQNVHSGAAAADTLGVKASNDSTLTIELSYESADFLSTLTTAICMPCNEEFFKKSVGKYGMSKDTVLCNGSYRLTKWNTEDFAMRIAKNQKYTGDAVAKNSAVYFSKNKKYTAIECLQKNYVDITKIPAESVTDAKSNGFFVQSIDNKIVILSVGENITHQMRTALFSSAVNPNDIKEISGYSAAKTIYPSTLGVDFDKTYSLYNAEYARSLYTTEYNNLGLKEFPQNLITYYGDENITEITKLIAGHWQQNLGLYINISKAESQASAEHSLKDGNHITVYTTEINQNDVSKYIETLGFSYSGNPEVTQNEVISSAAAIPIAFGSSYYAHISELTNVTYSPTNGIIDFSVIVKKQ